MANYYIADLHLGHANAIEFDKRPFADLTEMHNIIVENWNKTVRGGDTVYILGDFLWVRESEWPMWLKSLSGNKVLITGNHDPKKFDAPTKKLFQDIKAYKEITDCQKHVLLFNYAIPFHKADHYDDCYMLYGHVHNSLEYVFLEKFRREIKESGIRQRYGRGNFINVGCMMPWMNYTPQTLNDIIINEAKWHEENPDAF